MTPSIWRILAVMFSAMYDTASSDRIRPSWAALLRVMAMRVSRSGGCMSAMRPPSKRVRSLSSRSDISSGGRSEVMTIWCPAS